MVGIDSKRLLRNDSRFNQVTMKPISQNTSTCLKENRYLNLCHGETIRQPTHCNQLNSKWSRSDIPNETFSLSVYIILHRDTIERLNSRIKFLTEFQGKIPMGALAH